MATVVGDQGSGSLDDEKATPDVFGVALSLERLLVRYGLIQLQVTALPITGPY